ncbi:hypothetical protein WR25_16471 [Diploscapter pachys]|uniref:Uncharacterized protein n=1 Tax=Diploscapter pachys TaxID=2018661 RepID=A0A2A2KCW5_9BILA|nr:hypothetical protein WR25_16471 [Diploscapter pachys]
MNGIFDMRHMADAGQAGDRRTQQPRKLQALGDRRHRIGLSPDQPHGWLHQAQRRRAAARCAIVGCQQRRKPGRIGGGSAGPAHRRA